MCSGDDLRVVELENITEEMAAVLYRHALRLDMPYDVIKALKRWEEYKKALVDGS